MKHAHKIIRDSIHGNIKFNGFFLDLLDAPEIQRLSGIKQLGLAHLVFPGAHHTRLEHSFGAYHMASMISLSLDLSKEEQQQLKCAALLHDIGHGPFSHTLESLLRNRFDVDHVDLTQQLINGTYTVFHPSEEKHLSHYSNVPDILEKNDMDTKRIGDIISGAYTKQPYLTKLLNSVIDVDQLDYLLRDAYYTGVSYGMIDSQRFFQTIQIHNDDLAIDRKGVGVVENVLMARALMYSSVYFHKTVRIAELMLSKSLELIPEISPFEYFKMNDGELFSDLSKKNQYQKEIVIRLKYRQLFKQAYELPAYKKNNTHTKILKDLENPKKREQKEREIAEDLHIPEGYIIIDVPEQDLLQAEPRIQETNISIINDEDIKPLQDYTPVGEAIRMRAIPDWAVMIITDEQYRDNVSNHAAHLLFSD